MPIYPYGNHLPRLGAGVFLAPSAELAGEIEVGEDSSFWFHTAARGDVNWIRVGARTSVQDGTILHVTHERFPLAIGADVVIGHSCMLHGCTLEDACLIGIGATIMDGCIIGENSIVAGGTFLKERTVIPPNSIVMGMPGKVTRTRNNALANAFNAFMYRKNAEGFARGDYRVWASDSFRAEADAERTRTFVVANLFLDQGNTCEQPLADAELAIGNLVQNDQEGRRRLRVGFAARVFARENERAHHG